VFRHKVLIVGLGVAGRTHLRALEQIQSIQVTACVDISAQSDLEFRAQPLPLYKTVKKAAYHHNPDVVVIATPTPTHAVVFTEVAHAFPAAKILVEKPAADNLVDARRLLTEVGQSHTLEVAYHMSFSPEVVWGIRLAQAKAKELGVPVAAEAFFTDPYQDEIDSARSRLGNSWTDSGINSLSVLSRFVTPMRRTSLRRVGDEQESTYEAHVTCRSGGREFDAVILTSWHVTAAAKFTRVSYLSGATLVMDHTAVAGYLIQNGKATEVFGSDNSIPRSVRRYHALHEWWLIDGNPIMSTGNSLQLHEIVLQLDLPKVASANTGAVRENYSLILHHYVQR
jgi:predicted dehydrogenase